MYFHNGIGIVLYAGAFHHSLKRVVVNSANFAVGSGMENCKFFRRHLPGLTINAFAVASPKAIR